VSTAMKKVTKLSPRQLEITRLLVFGYSRRQIMQKLGIRAATLDTHRTNIRKKLGVHTIVDLVWYAIINKLVSIEEYKGRPSNPRPTSQRFLTPIRQ
jgi:two-component system, NarL family, response regulator NreC